MTKAWIALPISRVSKSYLAKLAASEDLELSEFIRKTLQERLHRAGINVDV